MVRGGKTDPVRFKGAFQTGAFLLVKMGVCKQVSPLRSRIFRSLKKEVFGTDIPRTSGGPSRGYLDPKLRSGPSKSWKNVHLGKDIRGPKARTSTSLKGIFKTSVRTTLGSVRTTLG